MRITTLAAAAVLALSSTLAFAQSSSAPNASKSGGEPGQNSQIGAPGSGGANNSTTGSSAPSVKDASKSGTAGAKDATNPSNAPPDRPKQ